MTEISSFLDQNYFLTLNDKVLRQKCRSNKIDDEIHFLLHFPIIFQVTQLTLTIMQHFAPSED